MKVIWSLEKVDNRDWNQQASLLKESVLAWNTIYPADEKTLYVDEYSRNCLETLGIIQLFDEVNQVNYSDFKSIDTNVFWASVKMRVIAEQTEPFIMIDNDFLLKGRIKTNIDSSKICFNFLESTIGLYPSPVNPTVRQLKLPFRLQNYSSNTSFLYIPNMDFAKYFAFQSLNAMENLSIWEVKDSTFMLLAEQLFFYSIIQSKKLEFQQLRKTIYDAGGSFWTRHRDSHGIYTKFEAESLFSHIGPRK